MPALYNEIVFLLAISGKETEGQKNKRRKEI